MKIKKLGALLTGTLLLASSIGMSLQAANTSHIIKYTGNYDSVGYPQKNLEAGFTSQPIVVDGVLEEAYASAAVSRIENTVTAGDYTYPGAATYGEIRTLWDGPVLYLGIDVYDSSVVANSLGTPGPAGNPAVPAEKKTELMWGFWPVTSYTEDADSVEIAVDLYNDKVVYETDTIGIFTIGADGQLYYYSSSNIPSLGSVMGDSNHPEYQNRIKQYGSALKYAEDGQTVIGYTVEVAFALEGLPLQNGTTLGLDVKINDVAEVVNEVPNPEAEGNSEAPATIQETKKVNAADIYWSHNVNNGTYTHFDHEHTNSVDWGNLTLAGWNGADAFAYSDWRIKNAIRYLDSASFAKGVYTAASQGALDAARAQAEQVLASQSMDKAATDAAADALEAAIRGLRWADERYPDPADLPVQNTLPNPYKFFGSDRVVSSAADWAERRQEILNLAQFYEYGFKPAAPEGIEIKSMTVYNAGDTKTVQGFWGPSQVTCESKSVDVTITITDNGRSADLSFSIDYPTPEQIEASGHAGKEIPVVLSYDGNIAAYREAGIAVATVPEGSGGDGRSNDYAWGTRTGTFYELYPYSRNGAEALKEVSSEMAAAWSASRVIDALEILKSGGNADQNAAVAEIDPEKLAVTGFSINGKYAFVAAVFDERIDVCIPGAAGATGPSPWRYVYTGHVYDWTGTPFAPVDESVSALQTASGTEMMANSIRHNRVREVELFRHFLTPGHFYGYEDGAYGFGTRLPFDQNDLVATLAPRAIVLENTVNDYNDGCEADSLGLQIAKSVYKNLGYDADALVKFNQRKAMPGDPHGNDDEQRGRSAAYLNYYFYGTDLETATKDYLDTDPFSLKVSNGSTQSPYDYYYGGFNTITGGTGGVEGRDGWYYYSFQPQKEDLIAVAKQGQGVDAALSKEDINSKKKSFFTEYEQKLPEEGVSVQLILKTLKQEGITDELKEKLEKAVAEGFAGGTIGAHFDCTLYKQIGSGEPIQLTELKEKIKVAFTVPEELICKDSTKQRDYKVMREHAGSVDLLDTTYQANNKTVEFETDKFSTYTLVYKDTPIPVVVPGGNESATTVTGQQNNGTAEKTLDKVPRMGDTGMNPLLYLLVAVFGAGAAGIWCYYRKQAKK